VREGRREESAWRVRRKKSETGGTKGEKKICEFSSREKDNPEKEGIAGPHSKGAKQPVLCVVGQS